MANLYDKAGLVNIPVGYQDGFLYNIKPEDNTLAFRFNRDSAATRVNKEGLIEQVGYFGPELVKNGNFSELGSELITNGDFSNWTNDNPDNYNVLNENANNYVTESNGQLRMVSDNSATIAIRPEPNTMLTVGEIYKVSVDLTFTTGTLDISGVQFNTSGTKVFYLTAPATYLQIAKASVLDVLIDNVSVKQVDPNDYWTVGGSWSLSEDKADYLATGNGSSITQSNVFGNAGLYKISFTISNVASGQNARILIESSSEVYLPLTSLRNGNYVYYANATANNNLIIRGYTSGSGVAFSITDVSVTEVLGDKPRIDYTDSLTSPSFLLEPQSTNLVEFSEDFSKWAKQNGGTGSAPIITSNSAISPDGTQNADKVIFNKGTGTTTSDLSILQASFTSQSNTASIYIKADSSQRIVIRNSSNWVGYDIGTEWTRIEKTDTGGSIQIGLRDGYGVANVPNTATVYLWGAQVEAISYATSYIPTAGSTATRAQETCNGAGNVSTFNSTEGVLYAEMAALYDDGTYRYITINDGTDQNVVAIRFSNTSNQILAFTRISGSFIAVLLTTSYPVLNFNKIAYRYKSGDFSLFINGTEVSSSTSTQTLPANTLNTLSFDNAPFSPMHGKVKGVYVFNEALTDDELQQLTGPEYNSFAALAAAYNYTVI